MYVALYTLFVKITIAIGGMLASLKDMPAALMLLPDKQKATGDHSWHLSRHPWHKTFDGIKRH